MAANAGTLALGTVTANCAPRDGRVQCRVENRGGDVRIDGEFSWSSAGVDVNATLSALPSTPPAVGARAGHAWDARRHRRRARAMAQRPALT